MKWKVIVCPDEWNEGGKRACLLCTDLGIIEHAELEYYSGDGKDIVSGYFVSGFQRYILMGQKIVSTALTGGLRCCSKNDILLPEKLEVSWSDGAEPDRLIAGECLYQLTGAEPELWITDPRAIWLSYCALLQDKDAIQRACAVIPTREQAEQELQKRGLLHDFTLEETGKTPCYGALNTLKTDLPQLLQEWSGKNVMPEPVDGAGYEIYTPFDLNFEYVTEIRVAGMFAASGKAQERLRWQVRHSDGYPIKLYLEREPGNRYDKNAILVMGSSKLDWERDKIGYVPREVAAELAPQMDRGETFAGWIEYFDPGSKVLAVSIFRRKQFPLDPITSLRYCHYAYGQLDTEFRLSLRTRSASYRKRKKHYHDTWQWLELTYDEGNWAEFVLPSLKKCNFLAWQPKVKKKTAPQITNSYGKIELFSGRKKILIENLVPWLIEEWDEFNHLMFSTTSTADILGEGRFGIKIIPEFEKK